MALNIYVIRDLREKWLVIRDCDPPPKPPADIQMKWRWVDCKTVVYFAYVRHTSARASARSSNGSRKVSECKIRPLRELDASV